MSNSISQFARRIGSLLSFVPLLLLGGCATFNHDWKKAAQMPATHDMQGRWQGVWISEETHHTDQLRCVVTRTTDGHYRARFHAKYHKVLSFGYTVPLTVQGETMPYKFSGDADLGWLAGGMYHYEGHADTTNYFATYSCKYDHGTFQMSRP